MKKIDTRWRHWGKGKRDVANVMKNATAVITILPNNKNFEFIRNENPRLGTLAVIGPAQGFNKKFDRILLSEIGIGSSRPYHQARGLNRKPNQSDIVERKKWFNLTTQQYCLIAPTIFRFIAQMAQETVDEWKSSTFRIKTTVKRRWSHSHKRIFEISRYVSLSIGKRFSIDKKDFFLMRDVYWAELNINEVIANTLRSKACFIDKRTDFYKSQRPYKGKIPFRRMKVSKDIEETFTDSCGNSLPLYHIAEIIQRLPRDRETTFYQQVRELSRIDTLPIPEQQLAKQATELGDPRQRLGEIQLRVTTGLNENKDYIVFEVCPPLRKETHQYEETDRLNSCSQEPLDDDVPF